MIDLSVIILVYNEEIHIRRCLENLIGFAKDVFVIDCYSQDMTVEIASSFDNVTVLQNKWVNHAVQFNWALDNAPIHTKWVLRLDADEYLTDELKAEMEQRLPKLPEEFTGVVFPLRRVFMGRTIRRGGTGHIKMLRMFQFGKGRSEVRMMDEHIELTQGKTIEFKGEFADDNLNDISWWTKKHIGYAIKEAIELLDIEYGLTGASKASEQSLLSEDALAKRKRKLKYAKKPLFWRAFFYFCYRYFFKLGFLEGKEGFMWHFFQGWWYRSLVDAKIWEIKKQCGNDVEKMKSFINEKYNITL